ncbi:splicing factor 1-like isoform X2 [Dysidea avara]|uniref:splicing factor 1-like isoform X2 n=1 Tax=Dysidea avara TaxID=196820 RepID=UPI003319D8F6
MATGANATPLGNVHPSLRGKGTQEEKLAAIETAKRVASQLFPENEPVKKRRKSRWGTEETKTIIPGLPTVLPSNLTGEHQRMYLIHLQIEENSRRLRTGDLGIPINPADRSPSPEPIYSYDGKRLNTREVRVKKRLEDERHRLILEALTINPEYKPPADYKAPAKKFEDRVYIPQDDHPETNFVGLIIGPRGVTLKQLETDTNTKIMIRGKGAQKDGKRGNIPQPGEDEPLHALITANTPETLKAGVDKVKSIVQSGVENPGNENEIKKMQMMQLAQMNGTLRPQDIIFRWKSGLQGSAEYEAPSLTSQITCTRCGGGGHIASDCKIDLSTLNPVDTANGSMGVADRAKMDSEYLSLMKELGEVVPGAENSTARPISTNPILSGTAVPPPTSLSTGMVVNSAASTDPAAIAAVTAVPFMPFPIPGQVPMFGAIPWGGALLPVPPGPTLPTTSGDSSASPWQQGAGMPAFGAGLLPPPFGFPPFPNMMPGAPPPPPPDPAPPVNAAPPTSGPPGTSTALPPPPGTGKGLLPVPGTVPPPPGT